MKGLVIGAGRIAKEYVKVLNELKVNFEIIGRSDSGIELLKEEFPKISAFGGGLDYNLAKCEEKDFAIIATPIDHLLSNVIALIDQGVKRILVEKPLSFDPKEVDGIIQKAKKSGCEVFIAFNRRFYASTLRAKELIASDGGISSLHFKFTELVDRIKTEKYSEKTLNNWGVSNSSHVIDTVFFLGGLPKSHSFSIHSGKTVSWHPSGSIFTGHGEFESGAPFTYHADWGSPGRWAIEIMTAKRRMLLSPMEKLKQQLQGSFDEELVDLDYTKDELYKSGFYEQTKRLLNGDDSWMLNMENWQPELIKIRQMLNYD